MTVDNALIVVHGDKATSQVIYTEYRPEKKGGPVRMTVQVKELNSIDLPVRATASPG